jgi:hypothetical protein
MRDAECVPKNDVRVDEVGVGVLRDPDGEALGGLAGGLRDVPTSGVQLGVVVWWGLVDVLGALGRWVLDQGLTFCYVDGVAGEACALPH